MNRQAVGQAKRTIGEMHPIGRMLQRKCACGNHTIARGECTECAKKNTAFQQMESKFGRVSPVARDVLASPGQAPEAATRASFMAPFGKDFSQLQTLSAGNHLRLGQPPSLNGRIREPTAPAGERANRSFDQDDKNETDEESPAVSEAPVKGIDPKPDNPPQAPAEQLDKSDDDKTKKAPVPANKIVTETVAATPADRARKKIGIGEEVNCSTDPATAATWAVSGGGTISAASGNSTKFTASMTPSKSTVKATIGKNNLVVNFDVVAPDGMTSTVKSDSGLGTKGPPNNQIGFETVFDCVVQPATVSFYRVKFQENIPSNTWTWPDGTADSKGPKVVPWRVGEDNTTTDTVGNSFRPIARLFDGKKNVNFGYIVKVPEEYKDESGTWVSWLAKEQHFKEFEGATQKGRATLKATNSVSGGWQGPWQ